MFLEGSDGFLGMVGAVEMRRDQLKIFVCLGDRLLFWDRLILLLFCVLILSLVAPSYSDLFLTKTRNGVKITLQTRDWILNSQVNSTVICGTYL